MLRGDGGLSVIPFRHDIFPGCPPSPRGRAAPAAAARRARVAAAAARYVQADPTRSAARSALCLADVWGLGTALVAMLTESPPAFASSSGAPLTCGQPERTYSNSRAAAPELSANDAALAAALHCLAAEMLRPNPSRRPTASDLVLRLAELSHRGRGGASEVPCALSGLREAEVARAEPRHALSP